MQASANLDFEQFRDMDCYAGIDLSSTSDLTCVNFMFPTSDKYYFKTLYYLPEAALQEKRFKDLYGEWRRQGHITITPGNVTDYDYILNDIMSIREIVFIQKSLTTPGTPLNLSLTQRKKGYRWSHTVRISEISTARQRRWNV